MARNDKKVTARLRHFKEAAGMRYRPPGAGEAQSSKGVNRTTLRSHPSLAFVPGNRKAPLRASRNPACSAPLADKAFVPLGTGRKTACGFCASLGASGKGRPGPRGKCAPVSPPPPRLQVEAG